MGSNAAIIILLLWIGFNSLVIVNQLGSIKQLLKDILNRKGT